MIRAVYRLRHLIIVVVVSLSLIVACRQTEEPTPNSIPSTAEPTRMATPLNEDIVAEPLKIHRANVLGDNEIEVQVDDMIQRVGLHRSDLNKYPYMFSGGQSQRIGIA